MLEAVAFHTPYACKVFYVSIMYTVTYTRNLGIPTEKINTTFFVCFFFHTQYFDKPSSCLHATQNAREN